MIWENNLSGVYSVASGYITLWNLNGKPSWAKAWLPYLTPKINIFFWLLLQNKILTIDNLAKRGHFILNRCILCRIQMEMVNHLFIHFPYSREVWNSLSKNFGMQWYAPGNISDFFSQWGILFKDTNIQSISNWALPHFYWGIWKERNN